MVIAIIFLFIGMSVIPSSATIIEQSSMPLSRDSILYVGGDGPGNYSKIQDAVDNASDGDTVFVYNGTYFENIKVNKSIHLTGENKNITIIDGERKGHVVRITANDVKLSGFTITHSEDDYYGIFLAKFTDINNITITDNNFTKNWRGIFLWGENHIVIKNSFVSNSNIALLLKSDYSTIRENVFMQNDKGIYLCDRNNNEISYNIFYSQFAGIWFRCEFGDIESNVITNNVIFDNEYGIYLSGGSNDRSLWCKYNIIKYNNVFNNEKGIFLSDKTEYNYVYHNNITGNSVQAEDYGWRKNSWDNGYPSGGNYWDDYTGDDNDGDGIGDTPYKIGIDEDRYPLMVPYGNYRAATNGPYYSLINISIQFNGFVCGGSPPYTWFWDLGDGNTSELQNLTHAYTSAGKYTISLSVTDNEGNTSNPTSFAWIQETNDPPEKPIIDGPTSGKKWVSYPYTFTAVDPEGAIIWYYIEWGDGYNTGWIGPYESGETIIKSHEWSEGGKYTIKCKAKDVFGEESSWGELTVTMPRNRATNNMFVTEVFRTISNTRKISNFTYKIRL